jgi:hypothetical protein
MSRSISKSGLVGLPPSSSESRFILKVGVLSTSLSSLRLLEC